MANQDQQVKMVHKDNQDHQDQQDNKGHQVIQVRKDQKDDVIIVHLHDWHPVIKQIEIQLLICFHHNSAYCDQ
ncbi:unnamed protein product [Wuchereria bancrofti]|uniref:Uncharacterized protein n=1 Tax=Wuchereria bancrofti TaxID=6293 RepID=A0A3P7G3F8_WUCBA|nr:unnamed protein product [Wuchereria bancrofti]